MPKNIIRPGRHPTPIPPLVNTLVKGSTGEAGQAPDQGQIFDTLPHDISFLYQFGFSYSSLANASAQSRCIGMSASSIMISDNTISEESYFRYMAAYLGLPFDDTDIQLGEYLGEHDSQNQSIDKARLTLVRSNGPLCYVYISPEGRNLPELRAFIAKHPSLKNRIVITTNTVNRRIFIARWQDALIQGAVFWLKDNFPSQSASVVITKIQSNFLWVLSASISALMLFYYKATVLFLHIFISIFYLICVWVRMVAALTSQPEKQAPYSLLPKYHHASLPVYSVLIALYHEEGQVADLVAALSKLQWPRSKLEIKLICEGDDQETIDAVKRAVSGPPFELVIVPPALPRTKPKALNFAFPLCKGRFLVLYDAEDRPHPLQLMEAYTAFENSDQKLACLQAPLVIHNHHQGWLPSLFAIEYSALFSGLLPALARWETPIPLGGTSNHFRRSALVHAGAWDPYNVTEDADLGIRLSRMGYKTGILKSPTYEEAPETIGVWIKQRSRWYKGWLQTWLVHMRHPRLLRKNLGWFNTFIFHAIITGLIVSALTHPLFLISLGGTIYHFLSSEQISTYYITLAIFDLSNILFGYIAFAVLAWRSLPVSGLTSLRCRIVGIPIYWLLISVGAWRAVWHLIYRPFEWEKTPHSNSKSNGTKCP